MVGLDRFEEKARSSPKNSVKQQRLPLNPPVRKTPLDRARQHHENNLQAARCIVAKPDKYRGCSLNWARDYLQKHAPGELPPDGPEAA